MTAAIDTASVPAAAPEWRSTDAHGWPLLPPTLLTVHRTSPRDEGSRQVVCRLDGVWITDLLFGDEHTVEVLPGDHELRLHNTLMWRTVRFTVAPGGHARFAVVNRAPAGFYALLLIIGVAPLLLEVQQQSAPP